MDFSLVQPFDNQVLSFFQTVQQPILTLFFQTASLLGNPVLWIVLSAILYWKGKEVQAVLIMNLIVFSALVSNAFKSVFLRPRPNAEQYIVTKEFFQDHFANSLSYGGSFPSGHATLISSLFSYWFGKVTKCWKLLLAVSLVCVIIARMYLGWHFLSDVIAGLILGILIGKFNGWLVYEVRQHEVQIESAKSLRVLILVFLCALALIWLQVSNLAFIVLGFYAGFYWFKKLKLQHQGTLVKQFTGFAGLGVIGLGYLFFKEFSPIILFLLGLWISFGNPLLYQKWTSRKAV